MTADIALKVGMAAGQQFLRGDHRHRVVIAKDTRLSGYMIEPALTAGFIAVGMDVVLVGPMPTPAVAMLVKSLRADLGVMISASHNPYQDNGIKLFGPDGYKLSDKVEKEIETLVARNHFDALAKPDKLGRAKRLDDAQGRYIEFAKSTFPKSLTLDGLKIVVDCANGAAYQVAPMILRELGAEVIAIGIEPNGYNINKECGSTAPEKLCETVLREKADIGIALDGDADRLIICDEKGHLEDGDQLLAMIATHCQDAGTLRGGGIVATDMSNIGPGTLPGRHRPDADPHQSRRPLRRRAYARARLQCRRRAIRPYRALRLQHHRRRHHRGAASACVFARRRTSAFQMRQAVHARAADIAQCTLPGRLAA